MAKAGYNHGKPSGLGKLIPEASGKEEHKVLKAKDFSVTSSKDGIGYTPPTPVHIPIRKASVSVISANYEKEEQSSNLSKKSLVFYRIRRPTSHISVFDRLGTQEDNKTQSLNSFSSWHLRFNSHKAQSFNPFSALKRFRGKRKVE
nr:hypothetical protein CFP56_59070 [Quercus suber]